MAAFACNGTLSPTLVHEGTLTSSRPSSRKLTSVPCLPQSRKNRTQCHVQISCSSKETFTQKVATSLTALGLSSALILGAVPPSFASESNILQEPPPVTHVIDDAGVLSRVTKADIKNLLNDLEDRTGFHIDVVTLRKITSKGDVFGFADQIIEKWYPTVEDGNKKGVVLLVTTAKEAAVAGGPEFNKVIGDELLEAIISENLPVLATAEKYNEALFTTAQRLAARIDGKPDVGGPKFEENKRVSNFKTKAETSDKRGQFTTVVGGLLVIAFVVPMLQYFAYVSKR